MCDGRAASFVVGTKQHREMGFQKNIQTVCVFEGGLANILSYIYPFFISRNCSCWKLSISRLVAASTVIFLKVHDCSDDSNRIQNIVLPHWLFIIYSFKSYVWSFERQLCRKKSICFSTPDLLTSMKTHHYFLSPIALNKSILIFYI